MACRIGGFSSGSSNREPWKPWPGEDAPFRFLTASTTVRGSMRSWTCRETVGTSNDVCSALPAQESCGSMWGSWAQVLRPASRSVSGVTRPTGGLFTRSLPGCA